MDGSYSLVFPGVFGCRLKPLYPVEEKRPLNAFHIEMVLAKNLQIAESIAQAQFVVRLEFVPVVGCANALQIFPPVGIPSPQSSDQSCRNDVIHVAFYSLALEIYAAGKYFAVPFQPRSPPVPPAFTVGGLPWPFPVYTLPTYCPFLRPESCPTEWAAAVAVGFATAK